MSGKTIYRTNCHNLDFMQVTGTGHQQTKGRTPQRDDGISYIRRFGLCQHKHQGHPEKALQRPKIKG